MTIMMSGELTEGEWRKIGELLCRQCGELDGSKSRHMWEVGDWLLAGESKVLRQLKRAKVRQVACEITGYSRHTLTMAVSVARKMPSSIRIDGLSWWHHLLLAKLPQSQQVEWLTRAAEEGWSVQTLRTKLRDAGVSTQRKSRPEDRRSNSKLIGRLVTLRYEEIPPDVLGILWNWWGREIQPYA